MIFTPSGENSGGTSEGSRAGGSQRNGGNSGSTNWDRGGPKKSNVVLHGVSVPSGVNHTGVSDNANLSGFVYSGGWVVSTKNQLNGAGAVNKHFPLLCCITALHETHVSTQ